MSFTCVQNSVDSRPYRLINMTKKIPPHPMKYNEDERSTALRVLRAYQSEIYSSCSNIIDVRYIE